MKVSLSCTNIKLRSNLVESNSYIFNISYAVKDYRVLFSHTVTLNTLSIIFLLFKNTISFIFHFTNKKYLTSLTINPSQLISIAVRYPVIQTIHASAPHIDTYSRLPATHQQSKRLRGLTRASAKSHVSLSFATSAYKHRKTLSTQSSSLSLTI